MTLHLQCRYGHITWKALWCCRWSVLLLADVNFCKWSRQKSVFPQLRGRHSYRQRLKVKVNVEVYNPVSSARRCSPDFTQQLYPGHRILFVHNPFQLPGSYSIQPESHNFWLAWLITHTCLLGPTRYPLTPGWERLHVWVHFLPKRTGSTAN